ncbi:nucleoside 2-deoxyribosyltransferase domain-containing protein [Aquimarina spongiae]|uniref:Nucleoside 2-deoxyribosyltransferase like n=1 Tax=Aquimarina spongiae TaxID=570521 RepID=A0A1M6AZV1_9FLAO|nr:nucleoside 2-deoxyribosyltransferase domain-containing protein [Aquimarina spongiae]SHI41961.1 Nucleoside 2-deoxyribosyltransferase like [Aquimarina spongiae]
MGIQNKVRVITAPEDVTNIKDYSVFLAGSIEGDTAQKWQDKVIQALEGDQVTLLNPRRLNWDASWKQEITNPQFNEQVTWELDALEQCDLIVMYFDKGTKSPISLLELGLFAKSGKLIVCCPEGFWRKGNVDIVCKRYGVQQVDRLEELIEVIKKRKK